MHHKATQSECGFSLVELLLVVGILAITAAFAIPALDGTMASFRLRSSADLIAGELDAARVMAISRGAVFEVRLYPDQRGVQVLDPADSVANAPRTRKFLDQGVTIVNGPTIQFQPRGSCTGTTTGQEIQIRNDSGSILVEVNKTGKIRVRYQ
ncbi:MAG: prepilin-type N-terminal cleavage/methylation domain-containing protein [Acidobacteria bacterium]|nr:MAG: prepilin-type N-terminal cleavage/methylation domain-containing protein [Acidobacteriota bacterium]